MKRRILALLLTLAMLLPCLMGEASAATSGSCGEDVTWKLDETTGTVTISGTGAMEDCGMESCPWYSARSKIRSVVIEEGVTYIGNWAFFRCGNLAQVTLPVSVTEIGNTAFGACYDIWDVYYGGTREQMQQIDFGWNDTLTVFPTWYFGEKKSLDWPTSGTCGENVSWKFDTSSGKLTISGTGDMTDFEYFENSMTDFGMTAPWRELPVKSAVIGSGVTSIGDGAFYGLVKLETISIPTGVDTIGEMAFMWCERLSSVTLPKTVTEIRPAAFNACTGLTELIIPDTVTQIGSGAFYNCRSLTEIDLPEGITVVAGNLLGCCPGLTEVTFPEGVTTLENWVFESGKNLTSITISANVSAIGESAFEDCQSLTDVYYSGTKAQREKMTIGDGNSPLTGATWHYRYIEAPKVKCSADSATGKPKLSWEQIDYAEKYRIYRATSKDGTYSYLGTTAGTRYTDTSAVAGTNYYYKVKALDTDTNTYSAYSNIVNRVCDLARPTVSLTVNTATGKPVVKWQTVEGAAKYVVYRSTSKSGSYKKVYTGIKARSYEDADAVAGTNYYYKVMAVHEKESANSAYSSVVNRVCDLAKPVLTITRTSAGKPWVKWDAVEGAAGYEVYRSTKKSSGYKLVKTTVSATSYADRSAKSGTKYYYKVMAIHDNTNANSAFSSIKYITSQ